MRATQALTLTTAATVVRRAYTADGLGGQATSETRLTSLCRCAASANMPDYQLVGARASETMLWRITFPALTDVQENDIVEIGARSYEVLGVLGGATVETARVCIGIEKG